MSSGHKRVGMLDAMRFAAAISVIFIHVSFIARPSPDIGEFLRFLMRWAVPFFFLLAGYFLTEERGFPAVGTDRLRRVTVITVVANLVYLPLSTILGGLESIDLKVITSGVWFHLWFLSSLVFGMLSLLISPHLGIRSRYFTVGAIAFIILVQGVDIFSSFDTRYLPLARLGRFLMSGPLMWVGFSLARWHKRPKPQLSLVLILGGVLICIGETILYSRIGLSIFDRQYPLGSFPIAVGSILWASSTERRPHPLVVKFGRDYSLVIYIVHPIFLKVASIVVNRFGGLESLPYWQIAIGAVSSLAFAYLIDQNFPWLASLLNGEIPKRQPTIASGPTNFGE